MDKRAVEYEGAEGCNQKAKDKQTGDDSRLVIELLEHAPKGYLFVPKKIIVFSLAFFSAGSGLLSKELFYSKYFVMLLVVVTSLHRGKLRSPTCFQNLPLQNLHQTFVPLLTWVCCAIFFAYLMLGRMEGR